MGAPNLSVLLGRWEKKGGKRRKNEEIKPWLWHGAAAAGLINGILAREKKKKKNQGEGPVRKEN